MSIYAIVSSPLDLPDARDESTVTLQEDAIMEGVRAGIFSAAIPLSTGRGALVEVDAGSESEARFLIDSLAYVTAGKRDGELALAA
jgi:hypothetical protein